MRCTCIHLDKVSALGSRTCPMLNVFFVCTKKYMSHVGVSAAAEWQTMTERWHAGENQKTYSSAERASP